MAPKIRESIAEPRYSQYYSQIRSLLETACSREIRLRHMDLAKLLHKTPDCLSHSLLEAVLSADGSLEAVKISPPSCSPAIDQMLMNAAKAAVPFPPPPPAIMKNGKVEISWNFVFENR